MGKIRRGEGVLEMERVAGVTDLHCHVLPGIDDGAGTLDEAVTMARTAVAEGIETVVATPHTLDGVHDVRYRDALAARDRLAERLAVEGVELRIRVAGEVHLNPGIHDLLDAEPRVSLDGQGRYVLLELPNRSVPPGLPKFLFSLQARGTTPVIAHPERVREVRENVQVVEEWIRLGALLQVTSGALIGTFGEVIGGCARRMLEHGAVHVLATDAHSTKRRPFEVQRAAEAAARIVGEEGAHRLLVDNPASVLRGEPTERLTPARPRRRRRFLLLGALTGR